MLIIANVLEIEIVIVIVTIIINMITIQCNIIDIVGTGSERSLDGSAGFEPTLADWGGSRASTAPSQAESQPEATSGPAAPLRSGGRPASSGVQSSSPLGSGRGSLLTRTPEQARGPVAHQRPGLRCKAINCLLEVIHEIQLNCDEKHVKIADIVRWILCGVLYKILRGCDRPSWRNCAMWTGKKASSAARERIVFCSRGLRRVYQPSPSSPPYNWH